MCTYPKVQTLFSVLNFMDEGRIISKFQISDSFYHCVITL